VVTADAAADAYTLPGWPCRIVITQGMLDALAGPERDVLLAHERAHARNSHYLFTSAARLAAAANPLLRPVTAGGRRLPAGPRRGGDRARPRHARGGAPR
jgi:Zn-dependent protease with chaperone function